MHISLSWVKPSSLQDEATILSKRIDASNGVVLKAGSGSLGGGSDDLVAEVSNSGASYGYTTGNILAANEWQYITMVYDGTQSTNADKLKVFRNGIQQTLTFSGTIPSNTPTSTQAILIGAETNSPSNTFNGAIDDVKIFNYNRSQAQINWEYDRGEAYAHYKLDECSGNTAYNSAVDGSGTALGNNGTIYPVSSGNTTVGTCSSGTGTEMWNNGTTGKRNASLDFDGTDDYISLGNTTELELPLSLGAWVKLDSTTGTQPIVTTDNTGNTYYTGAWLSVVSGAVQIGYGDNSACGTTGYRIKTGTSTLSTGTWYYIVGVITDSTDMEIYINGRDDGGTYTGSGGDIDYGSDNAAIGTMGVCPSGDNYFNGQIDDVKI